MTTHDELPSPLPAGTWEIDWDELEAINMQVNEYTVHVHPVLIHAVIANYRRQQAAQGIVEVRREDVQSILTDYQAMYDEATVIHQGSLLSDLAHDNTGFLDYYVRLHAALAAAKDQNTSKNEGANV